MNILSAVAMLIYDREIVYVENMCKAYLVPLYVFEKIDFSSRSAARIMARYECPHHILDVLGI